MRTPPSDLAEQLLAVGEQVLRSDPPSRLEDVAKLLGTSRARLYYYFAGRDDLVEFLVMTHVMRGAAVLRAALDAESPAEHRLRAAAVAMVGYLGENPGFCEGLLGGFGETGRMSEVMAANEAWIAQPLRQLLTEGQRSGEFDISDVADAANAVLGAILLATLGRSMSNRATDESFCERLADQVVRGVLSGRS